MAHTPKTIRKQGCEEIRRRMIIGFPRRDWKARRRLYWRATAADARQVMKPYRDPHKRLYAYKDLPAPKPITGPLRPEVDRLREDPEGWTFWVRAELVQEDGPPIELRGVWCFPVRDGNSRRFVERYALGIEAGVIVANMELRMDVYGNPFIHFDCQPWTERQPRLALRRIPILEAGLAERGIPPWTGGPGSGRRRSRETAETVNASILCQTCRAKSREEWI